MSSNNAGLIARLGSATRRNNAFSDGSPQSHHIIAKDDNTISTFFPDHESTQNLDVTFDADRYETDSVELGRAARATAAPMNREDSLYDITELTINSDVRARDHKTSARKSVAKRAITMSQLQPPKTRSTPVSKRAASSSFPQSLNAKVTNENEFSLLVDEHQLSARKAHQSRLVASVRRPTVKHAIPTRFTASGGLESQQRQTADHMDLHRATNHTAQSFILPDLPNITELVSGMRNDSTPVFSRTTKTRSRFTSATHDRVSNVTLTNHAQIVSIPLPDEEKAIFASLQSLKDRVAELETDNKLIHRACERHIAEKMALEAQLNDAPRLGVCQATKPTSNEPHTEQVSPKELPRNNVIHAKGLDVNAAIDRLTAERNSLITQLGVAFYSNEELKHNNSALHADRQRVIDAREDLQTSVADLTAQLTDLQARHDETLDTHDVDRRDWLRREAQLVERISRRNDQNRAARKVSYVDNEARINSNEHQQTVPVEASRAAGASPQAESEQGIMAAVEQQIRNVQQQVAKTSRQSDGHSHEISPAAIVEPILPSRIPHDEVSSAKSVQHNANNGHSEANLDPIRLAKSRAPNNASYKAPTTAEDDKDITYLSFIDPAEIANLRKRLEDERRASKAVENSGMKSNNQSKGMQRKSSLRDLGSKHGETDAKTSICNIGDIRSVRIQSPRSIDAMSAQAHGESVASSVLFNEHPSSTSNALFKPSDLPVPVTERDIDETAATIRPSTSPVMALTHVLKQLEIEVSHLKHQLAALEKSYEEHDPAMQRTKRLALKSKIDELLEQIEQRSEQVYALYDVLEAHKQSLGSLDKTDGGANTDTKRDSVRSSLTQHDAEKRADFRASTMSRLEEAGLPNTLVEDDVDETLSRLGIDRHALCQRLGALDLDGDGMNSSAVVF